MYYPLIKGIKALQSMKPTNPVILRRKIVMTCSRLFLPRRNMKQSKRKVLSLEEKIVAINLSESCQLSLRKVAAKFGVGKTQIANIIKNKTKYRELHEQHQRKITKISNGHSHTPMSSKEENTTEDESNTTSTSVTVQAVVRQQTDGAFVVNMNLRETIYEGILFDYNHPTYRCLPKPRLYENGIQNIVLPHRKRAASGSENSPPHKKSKKTSVQDETKVMRNQKEESSLKEEKECEGKKSPLIVHRRSDITVMQLSPRKPEISPKKFPSGTEFPVNAPNCSCHVPSPSTLESRPVNEAAFLHQLRLICRSAEIPVNVSRTRRPVTRASLSRSSRCWQ